MRRNKVTQLRVRVARYPFIFDRASDYAPGDEGEDDEILAAQWCRCARVRAGVRRAGLCLLISVAG